VAKKLNPDATEADLGGKMEAYYDKKLGRWIFPGDDPNEVAKPLAPPPVAPAVKDAPKQPVASNDPLAALMAPPSRGLTTANRTVTRSRYADPLAAMGAVAPSSGTPLAKGPSASMASSEPPKFTVF